MKTEVGGEAIRARGEKAVRFKTDSSLFSACREERRGCTRCDLKGGNWMWRRRCGVTSWDSEVREGRRDAEDTHTHTHSTRSCTSTANYWVC